MQEQRAGLLQLDAHLRHGDLFGGIHAPLHRRHAGHFAAQILNGEIVSGLCDAHVGGRERGEHVRPAHRRLVVHAARHELLDIAHEHIVEQDVARHRAAHAERIPVAADRESRRIGGHGDVHRVARGAIGLVFGAQHAVVVRGAGQGGEDLLAVEQPAALDLGCGRAERRLAGRGRAAFGKRLRVDLALLDDALEVHGAIGFMLLAIGRRHVERFGQGAAPHRGARVHVERECGGAAIPADGCGDDAIGGEISAQPAVLLRYAQPKQPGIAQIVVVLEWKTRFTIVLGGARGELLLAQRFGQCHQAALLVSEGIAIADDRRRDIALGGCTHRFGPQRRGLAEVGKCSARKCRNASLNASGCSILARWPAPGSST